MRLRTFAAALALIVALTAAGGLPPPAAADPPLSPTAFSFLPSVRYDPTYTPTATPTTLPSATPTPTLQPAAGCHGDEEVYFVPDPGTTGSPFTIRATSARPSTNVRMQLLYGGQEQVVTWVGVQQVGNQYVWSWSFWPALPGQYTARFYVNTYDYCAGRNLQVNGDPVPPPSPTATFTATPTRVPSQDCGGDEAISFAPDPGATGSSVLVSVTSAQPSVNVVLQVLFGGAGQAVYWQGVDCPGGLCTWRWSFIPYQPGWYEASFYVNDTAFCAVRSVRADGPSYPTPTPSPTATQAPATATPSPTRTAVSNPTPTPTSTGPLPTEWDWRLTFLRIGIQGSGAAPGQPYWHVVKGVFEGPAEEEQGHAIAIEILDSTGTRVNLPYGTEVGFVLNGGQIPLWWTKLDMPYPAIHDMYGTLGSYSAWLTLWGLPSERVTGMGLVDTDEEGNLTNEVGGRVHCNYKLTFRRTVAPLVQRIPARPWPYRWLPWWPDLLSPFVRPSPTPVPPWSGYRLPGATP